jgi:hypothetical protein
MEKTWTKEEIQSNLIDNDIWVYRGVVALYERQTDEEKEIGDTKVRNNAGFNGRDAQIMSSFACQIIDWNDNKFHKFPTPLSNKQLGIARKRIMKYSGQLAKIANGEL